MFKSLQSKITAGMFSLVVVTTVVGAVFIGIFMTKSYTDSIRRQMQTAATSLLSLGITDFSELADFDKLNDFIEGALQMERVDKMIRIFDERGRLLFTTIGTTLDDLPWINAWEIKAPTFKAFERGKLKYDSIVLPYAAGRKKFYLQVVMPLPRHYEVFRDTIKGAAVFMCLLFLFAFILSRSLSSMLLKPVAIIAEYLSKLDPARIKEWQFLTVDVRGEYLEPIVRGINILVSRTKASVSRLQKMSRFVAHEIRTPLTILRGEAELALSESGNNSERLREVIKSSLEEIGRMNDIVETVMEISKDEELPSAVRRIKVDLAIWLKQNLPRWQQLCGVPIILNYLTDEELVLNIDDRLLYRLMDNLLRNVRDHGGSGVECFIEAMKQGGDIMLVVEDSGFGVSDELIAELNLPSIGSDKIGVGLTLCIRVAELLGIKMRFARAKIGGLRVEMLFSSD